MGQHEDERVHVRTSPTRAPSTTRTLHARAPYDCGCIAPQACRAGEWSAELAVVEGLVVDTARNHAYFWNRGEELVAAFPFLKGKAALEGRADGTAVQGQILFRIAWRRTKKVVQKGVLPLTPWPDAFNRHIDALPTLMGFDTICADRKAFGQGARAGLVVRSPVAAAASAGARLRLAMLGRSCSSRGARCRSLGRPLAVSQRLPRDERPRARRGEGAPPERLRPTGEGTGRSEAQPILRAGLAGSRDRRAGRGRGISGDGFAQCARPVLWGGGSGRKAGRRRVHARVQSLSLCAPVYGCVCWQADRRRHFKRLCRSYWATLVDGGRVDSRVFTFAVCWARWRYWGLCCSKVISYLMERVSLDAKLHSCCTIQPEADWSRRGS